MMKMKAVNHKPMIYPEGTLTLQGREEVSLGVTHISLFINKAFTMYL